MSKIFTHDQTPGGARVVVERASDGSNVYRPATAGDGDAVQIESTDPVWTVEAVAGLILLIAFGVALYFWWRWILLGGFAFLLLLRLLGGRLS